MIIDFNKGTLQQECDTRVVKVAIVLFLFVTWLCTPPGNKFAQVCLYGNFTRHFVANIVNKDSANFGGKHSPITSLIKLSVAQFGILQLSGNPVNLNNSNIVNTLASLYVPSSNNLPG